MRYGTARLLFSPFVIAVYLDAIRNHERCRSLHFSLGCKTMRHHPSCWNKVLAKLGYRRVVRRQKRRSTPWGRQSRIESLETRQMLAGDTYTITTLTDVAIAGTATDDLWSLREALNHSAADVNAEKDVISFGSLTGEIALGSSGQLVVGSDVDIVGPGADKLTINAGGNSRVVSINAGVEAKISGLKVTGGGNVATGGGVLNNGDLTLDSVVIAGNTTNLAGYGGGVLTQNGVSGQASLRVFNSTIDANRATHGSGLYLSMGGGVVVIDGSTVSNNVGLGLETFTYSGGGGMAVDGINAGSIEITNSTFSGNRASHTGGIRLQNSLTPISIVNSTIAYNVGNDSGGLQRLNNTVAPVLHNTIIAENKDHTTPTALDKDIAGAVDTGSTYNLIGRGGAGGLTHNVGNNIVLTSLQNAGLAPLDYYGSSTKTHALLNSSPAIDKGSDLVAGASDQRGHSRAHEMPGSNGLGGSSDIGAFEADDALTLLVNNAIDRNSTTATSSDLTLREALAKSRDLAGTERIEFADALSNATLLTSLGELHIEKNVVIAGPGASRFTVKSTGAHRVLVVDPAVETTISGLTITGGGGVTEAAGIFNWGRLTLDAAAVVNNQATWSGSANSVGGGIVTRNFTGRDDAALRLINSTIDGNRATYAGGLNVSVADGGFLEIIGSTISNNTALNQSNAGAGGGMIVAGTANAPITISNSTISGNSSFHSGGIRLNSATTNLSIIQSTINSNRANVSNGIAGGVHNAYAGTITVHNSIIAGNQASNLEYRDIWGNIAGTILEPSSNNILGLQQSTHLISEARHSGLVNGVNGNQVGNQTALKSAHLTPLLDFGGPTKTHALLPTSPAIDAGNEEKTSSLDQRGFARYDHPGVLASIADIGAFEYRPEFVVTTLEDVDVPAGELSLRQALFLAANNSQAETITFAPELFQAGPATITLAYDSGDAGSDPDALPLYNMHNVYNTHLLGPGADLLTVSGADKTGVISGSGQAIIEGITITDGKSASSGGAITFSGSLTLRKSRITGNEAQSYGGGIYSYGWLHIEDSEISDNKVTVSSGGAGGGIFHRNVYYYSGSNLFTISNSTISGNQVLGASGMGGGFYTYLIDRYSGSVALRNVTVSKNSAAIGGGVMSGLSYGTNNFVRAENSIIAGNTTLNPATPSNVGALTFAAGSVNNLIGYNGGTGGLTHNQSGNKILGSGESDGLLPLDFYGGSTRTHALLPTSPAVDAGNDLLASPQDQRGFTRTDVAGMGASVTDIGAFEYQSELIVNSTADGPVGHGELTLRNALLLARKSTGQDVIRFAPEVSGEILLTQGELTLDGVTIEGPGAEDLTINAQGLSRVFNVMSSGPDPFSATIRGLRLTGGNAGAIATSTGMASVTLDELIVEGNVGGGVYAWYGPTITDSAIINNSGGPALDVRYGGGSIRNVTVSGNTSRGTTAGVYLYSFSGTLTNVTIVNNLADLDDNDEGVEIGGVTLGGNTTAKFVNSIIAQNSTYAGGEIVAADIGVVGLNNTFNATSVNNVIGAVVSGTFPSGGNTNTTGVTPEDLKLSPLGDYGGPTPTHALLPGSLAIDGGSNAAAGSHVVDQRGFERIEDGDFDGILTIDVGAYEFSLKPTIIVDTLVDENGGSAKLSLREAILRAKPGEVIGFAPELDGGTINLTGLGDLVIKKSLIITAHNLVNGLTIKGYDPTPTVQQGDGSRIFDIGGQVEAVMLVGMTLSGGDPWGNGGAIRSTGTSDSWSNFGAVRSVGTTLFVTGMTFHDNRASRLGHWVFNDEENPDDDQWVQRGIGGAIFSTGRLVVTRSHFWGNRSGPETWPFDPPHGPQSEDIWDSFFADDIYISGDLTIRESTFGDKDYTPPDDGLTDSVDFDDKVGGIYVDSRSGTGITVEIVDSTISYGKGLILDGSDGATISAEIVNSDISHNTALNYVRHPQDFMTRDTDVWGGFDFATQAVLGVINADLNIRNSTFSYNSPVSHITTGDSWGQIVSITKSRVLIEDSTFEYNHSAYGAGVVTLSRADVVITGSSFSKNSGGSDKSAVIGVREGGRLTLEGSTLSENHYHRGTIVAWDTYFPRSFKQPYGPSEVVIKDSIISGNVTDSAAYSDYRGGVIDVNIQQSRYYFAPDEYDWSHRYHLTIQDSTISNNKMGLELPGDNPKSYGGAVSLMGRVSAVITGSAITGNESKGSGAAINSIGANVHVDRSTISGNYAHGLGGAIYVGTWHEAVRELGSGVYRDFFGQLYISNSTITNNRAAYQGGGLFIDGAEYYDEDHFFIGYTKTNLPISYLFNNIIAGNQAEGKFYNPTSSSPFKSYPFAAGPDGPLALNSQNTHDIWLTDPDNLSPTSSNNIIGRGTNVALVPNDDRVSSSLRDPAMVISNGLQGNKIGLAGGTAIDPLLTPLGDYGGKTQTHALKFGSPAIDAGTFLHTYIKPKGATSSTATTDLRPAQHLIDGSGFADPSSIYGSPNGHNYSTSSNSWSTAIVPEPATDYFAAGGVAPTLTFDLGGLFQLDQLLIWALTNELGVLDSSAKSITLNFYRDGGPVGSAQSYALSRVEKSDITLTTPVVADEVRITITDNHHDPAGGGGNGNHVGLGEVRFGGIYYTDQRGEPFQRERNGNSVTEAWRPFDIGAFEVQQNSLPTLVVTTLNDEFDASYGTSALSLREAIAWANANPGADTITFDPTVFSLTGADKVIHLTRGELRITDALTITASVGVGGQRIIIDASSTAVTPGDPDIFGSRVFNVDDGVSSSSAVVSISGLTIKGGRTRDVGGGVRSMENLSLTNVIVTDNASYDRPDPAALAYPIFHPGGHDSYLEITASGGGVYAGAGSITITGSQIIGNHSDYYGGGISIVGGAVATVTNTTIDGNEAVRGWGVGGTPIFERWLYDSNYMTQGGGVYVSDSALTLSHATISGNSAFHGGGVFVIEGPGIASLTATNLTVSGNRAERMGGGIAIREGANLTLRHSTVTKNKVTQSSLSAGGVYFDSDGQSAQIIVDHSIIAQNDGLANLDIDDNLPSLPQDNDSQSDLRVDQIPAAGSVVQYSLIGDVDGSGLFDRQSSISQATPPLPTARTGSVLTNLTGTSNYFGGFWYLNTSTVEPVYEYVRPLDAMLDVLADNGGPTWTHALRVGSWAIDHGQSGLIAGSGTTPLYDQRGVGFGRITNGGIAGSRIDIGAYEARSVASSTMSLQLLNAVTSLPEDVNIGKGVRVADLNVLHGQNLAYTFTLTGPDVGLFEVIGRELWLRTTAIIDFETNPVLNVSISAADITSPTPRTAGPVSLAINLLNRNDAPSLDVGVSAQIPLSRNASAANVGVLASELLGNVVDQDANALKGLLIIGVDAAVAQYGRFEYTTNAGVTWRDLSLVSEDAALPLKADVQTRIRFVPHESFQGTLANALRFRAWDQTSGFAGQKASLNSLGNSVSAATTVGQLAAPSPSPLADQSAPASATNSKGETLLVWAQDGKIIGQRVSADGGFIDDSSDPNKTVFEIGGESSAQYLEPDVAAAPDGGFIVVWRTSDSEVIGRRLSSTGAFEGSEFSFPTVWPSMSIGEPLVAVSSSGKFVVAWRESNFGAVWVFARQFESLDDTEGSDPLTIESYLYSSEANSVIDYNDWHELTSLEMKDDNSFVVTRDRWDWTTGHGRDVYIGHFKYDVTQSSALSVLFDARVSPNILGDQKYSKILVQGTHAYLAWADFTDRSIHLQRYELNGTTWTLESETIPQRDGNLIQPVGDFDARDSSGLTDPTVNWVNGLDLAIDAAGRVGVAWSTSDDANLSGDASTLRIEWRSFNELTNEWTDHGSYENAGDWHSPSLSASDAGVFQLTAVKPVTGPSGTRDEVFTQRFASEVAAVVAVSPRAGDPIVVNSDGTFRDGQQRYPSVAIDLAGNAIHTWYGNGPQGTGIYARRIDANGAPINSSFLVTNDPTAQDPRVAVDSSGNVLFVWRETVSGASRIVGARYELIGQSLRWQWKQPLTSGAAPAATTSDSMPSVAVAADGSFVVAWSGLAGSAGNNAYAQLFNASGAALSLPQGLNGPLGVTHTQTIDGTRAVVVADGAFYVAFSERSRTTGEQILYLQKLDSQGVLSGSAVAVGSSVDALRDVPPGSIEDQYSSIMSVQLAANAEGEVAVAWAASVQTDISTDYYPLSAVSTSLFLRRWDGDSWDGGVIELAAADSVQELEYFTYSPGSESVAGPAVAFDDAGRLGVAWHWSFLDGASPSTLVTRWFEANGAGAGTYRQPGGWLWFQLAGGPNGAFQLAGTTSTTTYGSDISMQRFSWGSDEDDADQPELEANGALRIDARDSQDGALSVEVRGYGGQNYVWINGRLTSILASDVTEISLLAGDENDEIDLSGLSTAQLPRLGAAGIVVRGGGGDDRIIVGGGKVFVDGGTGNDTYVLSNKKAADVTIQDQSGVDKIEIENEHWQGALGAVLALGYRGVQTITRGPDSAKVTLAFVNENEVESFVGGSQHVIFSGAKPSLVVTTAADELDLGGTSTGLSLREALMWAKLDAQPDVITFSLPANSTIYLDNLDDSIDNRSDQLVIDSAVEIDASTATGLTISGDGDETPGTADRSRVFYVASNGAATFRKFTITGGVVDGADDDGGGVLVNGTLILDRVTVSGNTAAGSGGGVAVIGSGAYLEMIDSTITLNYAPYGAGLSVESAKAVIGSSTIDTNGFGASTPTQGGGVRQVGASNVTITNSTISGNRANTGGGIHTSGSGNVLKLTNVTIAFNQGTDGGGIYASGAGAATPVTMYNTIVAKNTEVGTAVHDDVGGPAKFNALSSHNFIGVDDNANNNINDGDGLRENIVGSTGAPKDPLLGALTNVHGAYTFPTRTHALLSGSTAANKARQDDVTPPIDQRGFVRVNGDSRRDVGAFELNGVVDNQDPTLDNQIVTVKENVGNGVVVAKAVANPDWRRFSYSIVSGNYSGAFKIDSDGVITVADASLLDAERFPSYLLQVKATQISGGSGSDVALIRVNVENVNEGPWVGSGLRTSVSEGVYDGATIGFVVGVDPENDGITYVKRSTTGGSAALEVDPDTGAIRVLDATKLKGLGSFELEVDVKNTVGALKTIARVLIEVVSAIVPTEPTVPTIVSADYEVSHRKELAFNPIAGFDNAMGRDFRVEFFSGSSTTTKFAVEYVNGRPAQVVVKDDNGAWKPSTNGKGQFALGAITLNADAANGQTADGSLKYTPTPELAAKGLLTTDEGYRFLATDAIRYKIVSLDKSPDELGKGSFNVKVTNDLPVFLQEQSGTHPTPAVLDLPIEVLPNTTSVIDPTDFFWDPDGDKLEIKLLRNTDPRKYEGFSSWPQDDEPTTGVDEIWSVAWAKYDPRTSPPFLKKIWLEKGAGNTVEIRHEGNSTDLINGYTADHHPLDHVFQIDIADGQKRDGKDAVTQFQISVRPATAHNQFISTSSIYDTVAYQGSFVESKADKQKIDPSKWKASAVARQASREGRDLQTVGDATVDLNSGALVRRHEMILDGSGGAAELSLPGLVYDSSTVDPRPVIQATLKLQDKVWPSEIEATFRWIDHVNGDASGPRTLTLPATKIKTSELAKASGFAYFDDVKEFQFSFQPPEAPLFTGVYSWEVEFKVTVENLDESTNKKEVLTLTQHGETPVVVQRKVAPENFQQGSTPGTNDKSPAWWNYAPVFGNGWALEGVPQLFVDDVFDGDPEDDPYVDDRLILYFPGEAPRVFGIGDVTGPLDERQDYGDGTFQPIDVNTSLTDRTEWGALSASENSSDIVYKDRSGLEYVFERLPDYASNWTGAGEESPAWRLREIRPQEVTGKNDQGQDVVVPTVKNPMIFEYADGSTMSSHGTTNPIHIKNVIGTDGVTLKLHYSGGKVDYINVGNDASTEYKLTVNGAHELAAISMEDLALPNAADRKRVRAFSYYSATMNGSPSGLMNFDTWHSDSASTSAVRSTKFDFNNITGLLTKVAVGTSSGGEVPAEYFVTSVASEGLGASAVINARRTAVVKTLATDLKSFTESSGVEKANGGDWITNYSFDARGHVTQREELFKPSSGNSVATQLGVQRWTYDQIGSVKTHEDSHLRNVSPKKLADKYGKGGESDADYEKRNKQLLGRMTYFSYDYEIPMDDNFISEDGEYTDDKLTFDPISHVVPVEQYDKGDYRGNVTRILSYAGVETFQYETRDAAKAALGSLVKHVDARGVVTRYRYNEAGQTLEVRTIRGQDDAVNASDAAKDHVEEWEYYGTDDSAFEGLAEKYINPLGLKTTYEYYEESRQLWKTTVVDAGLDASSGATSDDETTITVNAYGGTGSQFGFLTKATTYHTSASTPNKLSETNFVYDATGLLRSVALKSPSNAVLSSQEYGYAPDGKTAKVVNALGVVTTYAYDKRGLLTSTVVGVGSTYNAHADGAGVGAIDTAQTTTFAYYKDGSLKSTTSPDGSTVTQYADPVKRQSWTVTSDVAAATSLNSSGTVVSNETKLATSSTFDVLGRLASERNLLTGAHTTYFYGDARHDSPTRIAERVNLGRIKSGVEFEINAVVDEKLTDDLATVLAYDRAGNVVYERQVGQAGRSYVFDELGYLASSKVDASLGAEVKYKTDPLGNVLEQNETRKDGVKEGTGENAKDAVQVITKYEYDQQGRVRRAVDALEQITEYDYAFAAIEQDRPFAEIANDLVRVVTTKVLNDPDPNATADDLTTKQYVNAAGQVVRETNALDGETIRVYDAAGNVTQEVFYRAVGEAGDPKRVVEYKYDGLNRLRQTIQHGALKESPSQALDPGISSYVDYFLPGQILGDWDVVTTAPNGAATKSLYDSLGNPVAVQQPDPGPDASGVNAPDDAPVTLYSYGYVPEQLAYAVTTRVTSKRGEAEITNVTRTHDETRVSRQVFNTKGDVLISAERTSNMAGDDEQVNLGDLLDIGFVVRQTNLYSSPGQLRIAADASGNTLSWMAYDIGKTGTGLPSIVDSPGSQHVEYEYDSAGNRLSLRQIRGNKDGASAGSGSSSGDDPADNVTTWKYDKLGRVIEESVTIDVDSSPNPVPKSRKWVYDGLTTTLTDRDGRIAETTFDVASRKTTVVVKDDGVATSYQSETFLNSDGSVRRMEDDWYSTGRTGDNSYVEYDYDEYGRAEKVLSGFTYDGVAGPATELELAYHDIGVRSAATWNLDQHGSNGMVEILTTEYAVDLLGRIAKINEEIVGSPSLGGSPPAAADEAWGTAIPKNKSYKFYYNADGSREKVERFAAHDYGALSNYSEYAYANDGRLATLKHSRELGATDHVIASYVNTFNLKGQLETKRVAYYETNLGSPADTPIVDDVYKMTYDGSPLSNSTIDPQAAWTARPGGAFPLDDAGNQKGQSVRVGLQNRLLKDAKYFYTYDDEGNLVEQRVIATGEKQIYSWDYRGRLLSVVTKTSADLELNRTEFGYDVLGRRVAKKHVDAQNSAKNSFTGYVFDGDDVVFEVALDAAGLPIDRHYSYGVGVNEVLAVDERGDTVWQFADQVGTSRSIAYTSATGWKQVHRSFDDFGVVTDFYYASTNEHSPRYAIGDFTDNLLRTEAVVIYAGHAFDADLGLYDMKARWYDPDLRRFLSEDPMGHAAGDANLYRYALGDPVNFVDPDGREPISLTLGVIAIVGMAYGADQFNAAAAETNSAGAEFYGKGIADLTSADIARFNARMEVAQGYRTRGAIGAAFGTLPFGGWVSGGIYAGAAYGFSESYASGAGAGEIAANTAGQAVVGGAFGLAGRAAAPFLARGAAYASPYVTDAGFFVASRLPQLAKQPLYVGISASTLFVTSARFGFQTPALARSAATATFFGATRRTAIAPFEVFVGPASVRVRTGAHGELRSAFARIEPGNIGQGTATNANSRAFVQRLGLESDDAGHAIGQNLGGLGGVRGRQIFPQTPNVNRGVYNQFEQQVVRRVKAGDNLFARVVPRYREGATRPFEVLYQVRFNGHTISRTFKNP